MNISVIFAGGSGTRMNTKSRPKQFLELNGKPIIIYTIELFDNHPEIDAIVVVCLESWIPFLEKMIKKFEITKVVKVVPGGVSGQDSIFKGLCAAEEYVNTLCTTSDTLVLIHDGVRPMIYKKTIDDNLQSVREHGSAITSVTVKENESLDSALRRFKRNCAKAGIQQEIRKREHYEKPSVKRKKKSEAARKRKYN